MIGNKKVLIEFLLNQKDDVIFEIKEKKEKRTLTQNAYYWSLVNQVASYLQLSPEYVHKDLIFNFSTSELIVVKSNVDVSRVFKYYQYLRNAKINGQDFNVYKVYVGSSKMSKNEFSRLLDGIIQECQQLDIPTLTKNEIKQLKYIENMEE